MHSWLVVYPALQAIIYSDTRGYAWSLAALALSNLNNFRYTGTCYHRTFFYRKIIIVGASPRGYTYGLWRITCGSTNRHTDLPGTGQTGAVKGARAGSSDCLCPRSANGAREPDGSPGTGGGQSRPGKPRGCTNGVSPGARITVGRWPGKYDRSGAA